MPNSKSTNRLLIAFAALLLMLVATMALSFVHLGAANTWVGMAIAIGKTLIVALIFMQLTHSTHVVRLASAASLLWLAIAIVCTMADYGTRGWDETIEPRLKDATHVTSYDQVERD